MLVMTDPKKETKANSGVEIILARMETHPEEFFGNVEKWKFIYKEYFRDAMTETEKGMVFDRIKEIRREEFTHTVIATLTQDDDKTEYEYKWKAATEFFK